MTSTPDDVVRQMCEAWPSMDAEAIAAHFSEDAVYHNIPMDPVIGREAIRQFIAGFLSTAQTAQFETTHQVAQGNIVLNERIDRFMTASGEVALPVAGVFEVSDGLITAWRDYFDPRHAAGLAA